MTYTKALKVEYFVEPSNDGWTITFERQRHGRFPSRRDALLQALDDLGHARRFGHEVRLIARRRDGSTRKIWDVDHMLTHFASRKHQAIGLQ